MSDNIKLYFQDKNLGLSESIQFGLNEVFKEYESCVVIEDDVCIAPGFYDFISTCLSTYKDRAEIAGITGLRYPFNRRNLDKIKELFEQGNYQNALKIFKTLKRSDNKEISHSRFPPSLYGWLYNEDEIGRAHV